MQGGLAALTIGLWLGGASFADAQTSPSRADEALAPAPIVAPIPSAAVADQIAARPVAADVDAGQITGASGKSATAANQLTGSRPRADAPPQLSARGQDRSTNIAAVRGHDRCDPAAGASARRPECARIIDNRADEFARPGDDQTAPVVHADAPPSSMVDDIVNGGTGTIVALPAK
ncbi:MAG TPA: hypothetical protein VII42_02245 [Caulobacteraceae bacterium]